MYMCIFMAYCICKLHTVFLNNTHHKNRQLPQLILTFDGSNRILCSILFQVTINSAVSQQMKLTHVHFLSIAGISWEWTISARQCLTGGVCKSGNRNQKYVQPITGALVETILTSSSRDHVAELSNHTHSQLREITSPSLIMYEHVALQSY